MPTKTTPLTSISITGYRQRQEYEPNAMEELRASIEERGLLHAPILRTLGDADVLVVGGRRIRAIKDIFALGGSFRYDGQVYTAERGIIPYTDLGELSELDAEEAELDENLRRKDLTWQEQAAAVARLHKLRGAQKAQAVANNPEATVLPTQTIAETSEEVTGLDTPHAREQTRQELIVAKHLDNPLIAQAKSASEAFKLLKKEDERKKFRQMASAVGASMSAASHTLLKGDCLTILRQPEFAGKFDVIITDPPYGMDAQGFGDSGGQLAGVEHQYQDSLDSFQSLMSAWATLSFHVTKLEAHAYLCCDIDQWPWLKGRMEAVGWYVFRTPIINVKRAQGRVPLPDRGPRRQYEIIMYCIKGKRPTNAIYPDVMETTLEESFGHGAQKPIEMYQNLLTRSAKPGDHILDSFCGTGPIFPACHPYRAYATGIELSDTYYGIASQRLAKIAADQTPLKEI